ncbi:glycosyltransferase [Candidatus Roizmanbacteria bacterium]|nr:glycosyltransferase [Candidatus Roizmanbacteria bacterium]
MKISLICTTLNEAKTIDNFINSFLKQTKLPDELIICDGGSTDKTLSLLKNLKNQTKTKIIILQKRGNRSIGRNFAISNSKWEIILCTDLGCELDKNWVEEITKPFSNNNIDVVAGYYKGLPKNNFEKCLVPYVLVMPDQVNPKEFLPATRSIAFKKIVWEKVGRFNERLSHNEDYVFARKLQQKNYNVVFNGKAIVYWKPRNNLKQAFIMFLRFAYGDAEARILRPKVTLIFMRYILIISLFILYISTKNNYLYPFLYLLLFIYIFWSIAKNYHYVKKWQAFYLLPLIQFTADISVMLGTLMGFLNVRLRKNMIKV